MGQVPTYLILTELTLLADETEIPFPVLLGEIFYFRL